MIERIVCAANKDGDLVVLGVRHFDSLMVTQYKAMGITPDVECEQGFVTSTGRFVTREEALVIAKGSNQIIRRCGGDTHKLYSENLY